MDVITTAINTIKDIIGVADNIGNADLKLQLLNALHLAIESKEENIKLVEENRRLKEQLDTASKIIRHEGYLTKEDDQEAFKYCTTCYGDERKLIQLIPNENGWAYCPKCKNNYCVDKSLSFSTQNHSCYSQYDDYDPLRL